MTDTRSAPEAETDSSQLDLIKVHYNKAEEAAKAAQPYLDTEDQERWLTAKSMHEACQAGVTQVAVAEHIGVTQPTVSRYLRVWRAYGITANGDLGKLKGHWREYYAETRAANEPS